MQEDFSELAFSLDFLSSSGDLVEPENRQHPHQKDLAEQGSLRAPIASLPKSAVEHEAAGEVARFLIKAKGGEAEAAKQFVLQVLNALSAPKPFEFIGDELDSKNVCLILQIIVDALQCGNLIGKRGSEISRIEQVTSCRVKITDPFENSLVRYVLIQGSIASVTSCQRMISHVIRKHRLEAYGISDYSLMVMVPNERGIVTWLRTKLIHTQFGI